MNKYCYSCGAENPEDAFWCKNCDMKLVQGVSEIQEITEKEPQKPQPVKQINYKSFRQYEKNAIRTFTIVFVISVMFIGVFLYFSVSQGYDFTGINCQINEDFWFEEEKIITDDGWTFTMEWVQDYTLDGIVLGLKTYNRYDSPYDPCNIFCPIDLLIGVDDVKENIQNYDYSISSFDNRKVCWYLTSDEYGEYSYFKSHTGLNHIIPHNEEVLQGLKNINVKDCVLIKGCLVNLYGTRGCERLFRSTDTHIGNYACEVILVDELIIE